MDGYRNTSFLLWISIFLIHAAETSTEDEFFFSPRKRFKDPGAKLENSIFKSRIETQADLLRYRVDLLKDGDNKQVELIFLIDASSSVGEENFRNELRFVRKLVADFTVGKNAARVAVVTFASDIETRINHLESSESHDKCSLLHIELAKIRYSGGNTFTLGALQEAEVILENTRPGAKRALFLITDGFSNNGDPVPVAVDLKRRGVKIFTFGIRNGNVEELYKMASPPASEYAYILESFAEFEALARRALHQDLAPGTYIPVADPNLCSNLCNTSANCCNRNSTCSCGTLSGYFGCLCPPGYFGSGLIGEPCLPCPKGTYNDGSVPGDESVCRPCPDRNQNTKSYPATTLKDCVCKEGFEPIEDKCSVITCSELKPPKNGYFVKETCANVLHAACGVRCDIGYELLGSSVRICQINGTWTGVPPSCNAKHCEPLKPAPHSEVICSQEDKGFQVLTEYGGNNEIKRRIVKRGPVSDEGLIEKFWGGRSDAFIIDTVCRFSCPLGFFHVGSKIRTCLPLTRWDGLQTTCKPITCSSLPTIAHGTVKPSSCTQPGLKHKFGSKCELFCDEGFLLKGMSIRQCTGKHGTWSGKTQPFKCVDVEPPKFSCPDNVTINTDPGKPYTSVNLSLPASTDNSGVPPIIWTIPPLIGVESPILPIGSNKIDIIGVDASENNASCTFWIHVVDKEPPEIISCEFPESMTLVELLKSDWQEPLFADNSGNVTVEPNYEIPPSNNGTAIISYTAKDSAGNNASCIIKVILLTNVCNKSPLIENAETDCIKGDATLTCQVHCKEGYKNHLGNSSLDCFEDHWRIESANETLDDLNICSEVTPPEDISQMGRIVVESDNKSCEESLNELQNDISTLFNLNGFHIDFNCSKDTNEEESNNIWSQKNRRLQRDTRRRNRISFRISKADSNNIADINPYGFILKPIQIEPSRITSKRKLKLADIEVMKTNVSCKVGFEKEDNSCVICTSGHFFNTTQQLCQPCPLGTYQNLEGQSDCNSCKHGYSTLSSRSRNKRDCRKICPPGSFGKQIVQYGPAVSPCRTCKYGEFQPVEGQMKCSRCNGNSFGNMKQCLIKENFCGKLACKNNGSCISEPYETCICKKGFWGALCDQTFHPCDSSPCLNGGSCERILNNNFSCHCPSDFYGDLCQHEVNACLSSPCKHAESCSTAQGQFVCDCLPGYQGTTCSEPVDNCSLLKPCLNNGKCLQGDDAQFTCQCTKGFSGRFCEKFDNCLPDEEWFCLKGDTNDKPCIGNNCQAEISCQMLNETESCFVSSNGCVTDYSMVDIDVPEMKQLTVCFWVQTSDNLNYGTIFSYATKENDNVLTLTDYNGFVLYVIGQRVVTDVTANDGSWHFVCVVWTSYSGQWALYMDGEIAANGSDLAKGLKVPGWGKMVVGQEQDYYGGGFNEAESFVGQIAQMEMMDLELTAKEVKNMAVTCDVKKSINTLLSWKSVIKGVRGNIEIIPTKFCKICGPPPSIFLAQVSSFGDYAQYTCDEGFYMKFPVGPEVEFYTQEDQKNKTWRRKCLKTGEWETDEPKCSRISCGLPPPIQHGTISGGSYLFEDSIRYHCQEGYSLEGPVLKTCESTGKWSGEKSFCTGRKKCHQLNAPREGAMFLLTSSIAEISDAQIGDQVEFICNSGYYLKGKSILTCRDDGEWDHAEPQCISCQVPALNPQILLISGPNNEEAIFLCNSTGEIETVVCKGGVWNLSPSFCSESLICPKPKAPPHGYLIIHERNIPSKYVGDVVKFGCRHGYTLVGTDFVVCSQERAWNISENSCQPITCKEPVIISNAENSSKKTQYKYGDIIKFRCLPGFQNFGDPFIRCEADSHWSRVRSRCIRKSCSKPYFDAIPMGTHYVGDAVNWTCPSGTIKVVFCQTDGTWSHAECD